MFVPLGASVAASYGMPNLPLVTVPHPIGGLEPKLVRAKAERIVDQVFMALTTDPMAPAAVRGPADEAVTAPDDLDAFQVWAMTEGWGDGLPVLPPTAERVARILGGAAADTLVAELQPRRGFATLRAIAINAALAGAGPEHLPVIVAAIRALADPAFNLKAVQTTTHPCTPLVIVNGPIARRLGVSGGANALGNGHRANAVIGRSVRLVCQNIGGAIPGQTDRATQGHPGKFTYCLAENEAESPWEPLHVERGFAREDSCVTVCGSEGPHNVNDHGSINAEGLVRAISGTLATTGSNNMYSGGEPLMLIGPEHAATIAGSGWSKADLKRAVWERAKVRLDRWGPETRARFVPIDPERFRDKPLDHEVHVSHRPEDLMVVVAGGPGKHSAVIPTFGHTKSVTVRVSESG